MQKVNKLVLDNAKNLAIKLSSEEIRKRVFVLSTAAMSVSDLLDDGELKLKHKNSLFKITSLDDVLEIADVYSDNVRVDIRVIHDEDVFYIPKSHEKFFATPEIYLIVRMSKDLLNIEPVGFIESSNLPKTQSNTEYYEYNVNILKPIGELKNTIKNIEKKERIFSKEDHAKIEELAIAFLDGEISESEKVFFVQHVMQCSFCREKLSEMNEFDNVVKQLNKYPDLLNDQTLDILTGALARAYSLPEAQPVFLPEEEEENLVEETNSLSDQENQKFSLEAQENSLLDEEIEEKPFLVEDIEENTNNIGEEKSETEYEIADTSNEMPDVELLNESILTEETFETANNEILLEPSLEAETIPAEENIAKEELAENNTQEIIDNETEDNFLLDFADEDEDEDEDNNASKPEDTTASLNPEINNEEDMLELSDLDLIDTNQNNEIPEKSEESIIEEPLSTENPKEETFLESNPSEELTLDVTDDADLINFQEQNEILLPNIEENATLEQSNDHLLLLGDEPELLEEKTDAIIQEETIEIAQKDEQNENKSEEISQSRNEEEDEENKSDVFPVEENNDNTQEELQETVDTEQLNYDIQDLLDDDLKSLLDASDDEPVINKAETNIEQTQIASDTEQTIDPAIQNIMDDELMGMLMEDEPSSVKEEIQTTSVPKQIAQKLSQQNEGDESIEVLYDEKDQTIGENKITVEESPVVKSAVNKTKQIAVSVFLILILLAGGATTYFMKFNKSPNVSDSDEQQGDNALFDFSNKPVDAEEQPPVPQDINKSMTNVFSEQPTAITITKISWNVSDKLAQNDAFKNYLQVAGKNLQINLQNDLANTTEFAYNNKIHLNFQVTKDNEIKNLQVLDSSGSEQIDNVVLRSIKETLKYINAPNLKDVKGDYNLSLIINF